jgi:group I intron endonuclease
MTIYSIYKVTNIITGGIYIGFTSYTLKKRRNGHIHKAFRKNSSTRFHRALREYPDVNWIWEVIYQAKEIVPPKQSHTLKVMENHFITEYDSINFGYNMTKGGNKWPIMRKEEHPLYGIGHSNKTKQLLSKNHHDVSGSNNPMYGRSGKNSPVARKFWALSPDGIRYEEIGILGFCRKHELTNSIVSCVLKGDRPHHKGWKFGYM